MHILRHTLFLLCLLPVLLFAQTDERDTVRIDFGTRLSPTPWNNVTDPAAGSLNNLLNGRGSLTGYSIDVTDAFNNVNTNGNQDPTPELGLPSTATEDSFFGNVGEFGNQTQPTAAVTLGNLDPELTYRITLFASRTATDNRQARYLIDGETSDSLFLDAASNNSLTVSTSLRPAADGTIVVTASPGPDNDNSLGFYYLGALLLDYEQQEDPMVELTSDTLLIDFGSMPSPAPWNNVTDPRTGVLTDLLTAGGIISNVTLTVIDSFNNINTQGSQDPAPGIGFPATATGDSFFGSTSSFGGLTEPTGGVRLDGLDPRLAYNFSLFASRSASDNREAAYVLNGLTVDTVFLDAASNADRTVETTILPAPDGSITVTAMPGPNNTNGSGFYYLGAMRVGYEFTPAVVALDTILVDFGGDNTTPAPWNNVTDPVAGNLPDLLNSRGFTTGFGLDITDRFNGINTAGTTAPAAEIEIPATASGDSFFGSVTSFGGLIEPTGAFTLSGLEPNVPYRLALFASRTATDNRETAYEIIGSTTDTTYLNASSNTDQFAFAEVLPAADGTIVVTASTGPNNTNGSGFYYLGALRLIYPDRAPAGMTRLDLLAPDGGETYQVGRTAQIRWESRNLVEVDIEYSTDAGDNWQPVATVAAVSGSYDWTVPATPTTEALVRLLSDTLADQSAETFTISSDTTSCTIVVLGSSTAAGTGASRPDSAWVNRFANSLADDTRYEVINLARGGANSYNILPTGSSVPPVNAFNVDTERNVTRALTFDPFAIIVNMPSNDAANNVTAAEQILNFRLIAEPALARGVKVYVATTQPRNFTNPAQVAIQRATRDSILAEFGEFAINFWEDLATEDGFIDPDLDSGDGVHVNDAGHRLLFERVAAKQLDTLDCTDRTVGLFADRLPADLPLEVYPNPTDGRFTLELTAELSGTLQLELFDATGRRLREQFLTVIKGEQVRQEWTSPSTGQVVFCVATLSGPTGSRRGVVRVMIR